MTDADLALAARQEQAQIRILEILREFGADDALVILASVCAATLLRAHPDARQHFKHDFPRAVDWWLAQP